MESGSRRKIFLSSAALLLLALLLPGRALAQEPVDVPEDDPGPSPYYLEITAKIDQLFSSIEGLFDQAETWINDLADAMSTIADLVLLGTVQIDDQVYELDEVADDIAGAMSWALLWRCYLQSPLIFWVLLFMVWIVIVMLVKFAITVIPYVRAIFMFLWRLAVDAWNSIPFVN